MICPHCGTQSAMVEDSCPSCHTPIPTAWSSTEADLPTASPTSVTRDGLAVLPPPSDARARTDGLLQPGQAFGPRYHVIGLLGVGGMGEVYRAWDTALNLAVAVKIIRPDATTDPGDAARLERQFKNELVLARQVTHKNVVRIHDLGELDGIKYITMPYIEGRDLATVLDGGPLGVPRSIKIARQLASGLAAAHDAKIVHRDLKPANIMIGAGDEATIMDFGIARSATSAAAGRNVAGTLAYMAPEQATGATVDGRADIYAFGLIVYEMLAGRRQSPAGTNAVDRMKARFEQGLPDLQSVDPAIPSPLASLVARCLERAPADRFQTSADLVAALDRLDDQGELVPEPRRLTKRLVAAAAAVVLAISAATYVVGRRLAPPPPPREQVPVLIADFANRTGDAEFDGTIEQTLSLALQGAPFISVMPIGAAHDLAAQLSSDKSPRVTPEVGQLIARREGSKVLVTGSVDRSGGGFRVRVEAIDPATGKAVASASRDAKDKQAVLASVASLAGSVGEALGQSKTEMAKLAAAETVTASSLAAMRAYSTGQEFLDRAKYPEAVAAYQQAVDLDPNMGRAYAGLAVAYRNSKQGDKAKAAYDKAIALVDRMTDREKYRTLGLYYFSVVQNYEKAAENWETLIKLFPADNVALANLAFAQAMIGNFQRAAVLGKQASDADPQSKYKRYNSAAFAMYAGDFETSRAQAASSLQTDPSYADGLGFLPMAVSSLALGDVETAHNNYKLMAAVSDTARSRADAGEADLSMYFGRDKEAIDRLVPSAAADEKRKDVAAAAVKYVDLADAYAGAGRNRESRDAALKAAALAPADEGTLFLAAIALARVNETAKAEELAVKLANMLQKQTTADADMVRGQIALARGDIASAIERFTSARSRRDSWMSHYLLGTAYAKAGGDHFAEAFTEFDAAVKRRGETTDLFLQDTATLRYLPAAYYWLGVSQETVGQKNAARRSYQQYLTLRQAADPPDPLAADAARRAAALPAN